MTIGAPEIGYALTVVGLALAVWGGAAAVTGARSGRLAFVASAERAAELAAGILAASKRPAGAPDQLLARFLKVACRPGASTT